MDVRPAACAACAIVLLSAPAVAQAPSADQIVALGTEFARQFFNGLTNVMAEEQYVQQTTSPRQRRVLRSDFYMVRYPGAEAWMAFRDVFEVDGKPVRVQDDRLMKLFVDPPRDALARASEIAREGARYNLRDIGTLNNPLFVMALLQPNYRQRFRFTVGGLEPDLGPGARTLRFEEWMLPTILRGNSNSDVPVEGLIWIDEKTGRVLKTELEAGRGRFPAEIVTTFRFDESLGIDVPAEMRDWYPDDAGEIRGTATYSRFRRFQVTAEEEIGRAPR
jgi:hypothetical protein